MLGQQLGLGTRHVRCVLFQRPRNPPVQLLAPALEQALISGVLNQCVLECVAGLWRSATAKDQLDGGQFFQ